MTLLISLEGKLEEKTRRKTILFVFVKWKTSFQVVNDLVETACSHWRTSPDVCSMEWQGTGIRVWTDPGVFKGWPQLLWKNSDFQVARTVQICLEANTCCKTLKAAVQGGWQRRCNAHRHQKQCSLGASSAFLSISSIGY